MTSPRDFLAMAIRANAGSLTSDDRNERDRAMTRILAAVERYADNRYPADEVTARREAALADAYGRRKDGNDEGITRCA